MVCGRKSKGRLEATGQKCCLHSPVLLLPGTIAAVGARLFERPFSKSNVKVSKTLKRLDVKRN
jgi:hypothetical protein